ncbi:MAG: hypothetical protein LBU39_09830 [Desulfobulbaceae bacterium]|nr:hypothetical protein [Desulfobulbaceae bacterium]
MKNAAVSALAVSLLTGPAWAEVEWDVSGFGTLGAVISDSYVHYQRDIDDHGTLLRDSLAALQVDVKINDKWSATSQVMLAEALDEDDQFEPQLKWTILSYRPSNDWLIRLGRMSLGGLLFQQSMDVGVSYDMLRLPAEVYSASRLYDFDGLSVAKTWDTTDYEITLDVNSGFQDRDYRTYGYGSQQPIFYGADAFAVGMVLTVTDYGESMLRVGWNYNQVKTDRLMGGSLGFTPIGDDAYTLGASVFTDTIRVHTLFLGLRFPLGDYMFFFEAMAGLPEDIDVFPPAYAGYVTASRRFGQWTPYLTLAMVYSDDQGGVLEKLRGATPVPQLGVSQTILDDLYGTSSYYDQQSVMLGLSYALTVRQKLKAEIMLTHVGEKSLMFDEPISHENVMIYSLAYSFMF